MASDEPCKCHHNFAYIAPIHSGHCCFLSPEATCHPKEFADYVAKAGRVLTGKEKNE